MGKFNVLLVITFLGDLGLCPPVLCAPVLYGLGLDGEISEEFKVNQDEWKEDARLQELFEQAEKAYTLTLKDCEMILVKAQDSFQEKEYEKAAGLYKTLFEEGALHEGGYMIGEYLALSYLYNDNLKMYECIISGFFNPVNYKNLENILKNDGDRKNVQKLKSLKKSSQTLFPAATPEDQAHWKL